MDADGTAAEPNQRLKNLKSPYLDYQILNMFGIVPPGRAPKTSSGISDSTG